MSGGAEFMFEGPGPYAGADFALLTMHGKEQALAPRLAGKLGGRIRVIDSFDTDTLGTFTRDVPRAGSQLDAALRKARLATELSGLPLGIGSEGSFTPGPFGLGSANLEIVALVDRTRGIEIHGVARRAGFHATGCIASWDELTAFAQTAGFPDHALVARPDDGDHPSFRKGLADWDSLRAAFDECLARSRHGRVFIESDLRAHLNPTRMATIGAACDDLIERMMCKCPACAAPGFGISRRLPGLPCAECGSATGDWKSEEWRCVACAHVAWVPRTDLVSASAAHCPSCNP